MTEPASATPSEVPAEIPLKPEAEVRARAKAEDLRKPHLFINRELSWLEFNARVLAEASSPAVPLFERMKFLAIFASNLDEFFMVRVAGLQAQLSGEVEEVPPDGMNPEEQLTAIGKRAHALVQEQYRIFNRELRPAFREAGIQLVHPEELPTDARVQLDRHFERNISPVLTPIAIDPVHPFPHVRNKSINLAVIFEQTNDVGPALGVVQVPTSLPRLIPVSGDGPERAFVALEDLIARHSSLIFPQFRVVGHYAFRVTRNFDIEIDEDEGEDLLLAIQAELRRRERGAAVRMEVSGQAPEESIVSLCAELGLPFDRDVYPIDGPLYLGDMMNLVSGDDRREMRDESFTPQYVPPLRDSDDVFETIRERDILLHHPYESFEAIVDLVSRAAEDPNVLAIKQTLYRTGGESPMVRALQRAAEHGKQVTALVELKARFDEESNIRWARTLERSGVNVMYGLLGFKTHAKVLLIVRQEEHGLRRYVHLATGNYNQQTARLYEDVSLITAREDIGEDASALFNLLTGYSPPQRWNHLVVAPLGLHEAILGMIDRERKNAEEGKPARIIGKMNSLVDKSVILALYEASRAGVQIDLLIRGICCLRPGIQGVSENIRVYAVIDRFLEHARIFYFDNGGDNAVYCSSADWMPRNFRRRVEAMFPILDADLRARMIQEILGTMLADNQKSWALQSDGTYARLSAEGKGIRSQQRFVEAARERTKDADGRLGLSSKRFVAVTDLQSALDKLRSGKNKGKRKRKRGS